MAVSEFELIETYFSHTGKPREDVVLGVGDDCALLRPPPGQLLAVSIDTLVEGVHFLAGTDPEALGHKALAVNLSDLAAVGASPAWATLALTLPDSDTAWLKAFSAGFAALAERFGVQLVGGDTTRGPLTITVQVQGFTDPGKVLRRDRARPGDRIGVTGTLGDAALALKLGAGVEPEAGTGGALTERLHRPSPRIAEGRALAGLANAAIDVSDGLLADLGHICSQSGVGALIDTSLLPLSKAVAAHIKETGDWSIPLAGGDDYELCFTARPQLTPKIEAVMHRLGSGFRWIGEIGKAPGVRCRGLSRGALKGMAGGYEHFGTP
jgi:thiamine-monophosphate kinase